MVARLLIGEAVARVNVVHSLAEDAVEHVANACSTNKRVRNPTCMHRKTST